MRRLLPMALFLPALAAAQEQLRNDSVAPGSEIAFYPRMMDEEEFRVILDGPEDYDVYRICRLLVWIGPNGFNVFTIRVATWTPEEREGLLLWQSDLDAYQISGSQAEMSAVDLRDFDIVTDADQLYIAFRHVAGFPAPPTIASDTDGITPRRNRISALLRAGWFSDFVEELPEQGVYPRPPGDWILRADVVGVDEICPNPDGPPVPPADMGAPPPPRDAGGGRDAQAPSVDAAVAGDARAGRRDAAGRPMDTGAGAGGGGGDFDFGAPPGSFAVDRIVPAAGRPELNVDVVINGRGFPFGEAVTAHLGPTRLLEATVRSESTITAIVPAGMAPGLYPLTIKRDDGQEAILPEAYTVIAPGDLALLAIEPAEVVEGELVVLSLRGAGFDEVTTFAIGGVPLDEVTLTDGTTAHGRLGATLTAGAYDALARRGAVEARLPDALTVVRPAAAATDDCGCTVGRAPGSSTPLLLLLLLGLPCARRR